MIKTIPFDVSPELEREIQFYATHPSAFDVLPHAADVIRHVENSSDYMDLAAFARSLPPSTILDIGVGSGLTSAYLALKGHRVVCVEPALSACERMVKDFKRLNLSIEIIHSTAEALANLEPQFDWIVFNSSLHHCDDPVGALGKARQNLKPNGGLFLFEPVLRFYRSKSWFYRMLVEHPEKVGHYGGNEHIYRFQEYLKFLRAAGFEKFEITPSLNYGVIPKLAPWDSPVRYAIKKLYYGTIRSLILPAFPGFLLRPVLFRLSILNPVMRCRP